MPGEVWAGVRVGGEGYREGCRCCESGIWEGSERAGCAVRDLRPVDEIVGRGVLRIRGRGVLEVVEGRLGAGFGFETHRAGEGVPGRGAC